MKDKREILTQWLKDAHSMETTAVKLLGKQADRLKDYPEMRTRVEQHKRESESQAQRVEQCLHLMGSDNSALKDAVGAVTGNMGAMNNALTSDEVVKNGIGDFAYEHFEIACYRSLIAAADHCGEQEVANICRDILREEEAMARWVDEHLASITQQYLAREASGNGAAKR